MIAASVPFAKPKAMTPINMTMQQKIISGMLVPEMSP